MQKRIIETQAPVVQVIAAAGSGKTRTVVELVKQRLASGGAGRGRILMLSFSRKACAEIRSRLPPEAAGGVEVSTFHSLAYRWMKRENPGLSVITDVEKERFLARQILKHDTGGIPVPVLLANKRAFFRAMPDLCFQSHRAFARCKRERGAVEFDDLVSGLLRRLSDGRFEELRNAYDLVIVDEFQDTDPGQLLFLKQMRMKQLVVVGDDSQSIYSFRGADPGIFLRFGKHFPGARILKLTENYRSTREITDCGNQVIRQAKSRLKKTVRSMRGKSGVPASLASIRPGEEEVVVPALKQGAVVLCRSNHRRFAWMRAGAPSSQVLTIHASKGLEFPEVFLDLSGGYSTLRGVSRVPDEEVRIAYVGLSRAEDFLCVLADPDAGEGEPERMMFELFRPFVNRIPAAEAAAMAAGSGQRGSSMPKKPLACAPAGQRVTQHAEHV